MPPKPAPRMTIFFFFIVLNIHLECIKKRALLLERFEKYYSVIHNMNMKRYYVYFARCSDDTLYAGYTTNLKRREREHNEGGGARYTCFRRPVEFIYYEEFETRSAAMKREYELKCLRKKDKESLVLSVKKVGGQV